MWSVNIGILVLRKRHTLYYWLDLVCHTMVLVKVGVSYSGIDKCWCVTMWSCLRLVCHNVVLVKVGVSQCGLG